MVFYLFQTRGLNRKAALLLHLHSTALPTTSGMETRFIAPPADTPSRQSTEEFVGENLLAIYQFYRSRLSIEYLCLCARHPTTQTLLVVYLFNHQPFTAS